MQLIGTGKFQLHHTGIKTTQRESLDIDEFLFQLHHTGIKTLLRVSVRQRERLISIAPYRN